MSEQLDGEMDAFNVKCFVDAAKELVRGDEVERALHLLDNLPGYYRDFEPTEITDLKKMIRSKIYTTSKYASDKLACEISFNESDLESFNETLRGDLLKAEVRLSNKHGIKPHIIDLGPGEFWLPFILNEARLEFTYQPIYLNHYIYQSKLKYFENNLCTDVGGTINVRPIIFVACEVIEHLWKEDEILYDFEQIGGYADVIHLSTPLYCYNKTIRDVTAMDFYGHLRTYTPKEFTSVADRFFPHHSSVLYTSQPMHIRAVYKDTNFNFIKETIRTDILKG